MLETLTTSHIDRPRPRNIIDRSRLQIFLAEINALNQREKNEATPQIADSFTPKRQKIEEFVIFVEPVIQRTAEAYFYRYTNIFVCNSITAADLEQLIREAVLANASSLHYDNYDTTKDPVYFLISIFQDLLYHFRRGFLAQKRGSKQKFYYLDGLPKRENMMLVLPDEQALERFYEVETILHNRVMRTAIMDCLKKPNFDAVNFWVLTLLYGLGREIFQACQERMRSDIQRYQKEGGSEFLNKKSMERMKKLLLLDFSDDELEQFHTLRRIAEFFNCLNQAI